MIECGACVTYYFSRVINYCRNYSLPNDKNLLTYGLKIFIVSCGKGFCKPELASHHDINDGLFVAICANICIMRFSQEVVYGGFNIFCL
jgi:hypothetical protein